MRGNREFRFFVALLAVLVYGTFSGYGLSLIGLSTVVLGHDDMVLGDVAKVAKDADESVEATRLDLHIPFPVLFSPAGLLLRLESVFSEPVVYAGGPVKIIPEVYADGNAGLFLGSLLGFLETTFLSFLISRITSHCPR